MTQSVVVQVGQCGNQIGCRFWDLALREHAAVNKLCEKGVVHLHDFLTDFQPALTRTAQLLVLLLFQVLPSFPIRSFHDAANYPTLACYAFLPFSFDVSDVGCCCRWDTGLDRPWV